MQVAVSELWSGANWGTLCRPRLALRRPPWAYFITTDLTKQSLKSF